MFHCLAQAHARYGREADTVINSHQARMLLLPGVADLPETLRYFSGLVGEERARERTRTRGSGHHANTDAPARRTLAPPEQLRQLPDGTGVVLYGRFRHDRQVAHVVCRSAVVRPGRPGDLTVDGRQSNGWPLDLAGH